MAEVKWIKITTDMFEDEKIDFIASLPEADTIIIVWIRLLTLAGKCNAGGYIYLTETIPYTDEMLAHKFRKPLNTIKLALATFKNLNMIEMDESGIFLPAWEKHQNVEGLEKIRNQSLVRMREYRKRKKQSQLLLRNGDVTVTGDVTPGYAIEEDIDKDKEIDNIYIPFVEIVDYLNEKVGSKFRATSEKTKKLIRARWNDGYSLDDFRLVIDNKVRDWLKDKKMVKFLRPETLFGTKFEAYLNERDACPPPSRTPEPKAGKYESFYL